MRLETYIQDAEREGDNDVAELFRKAQSDSRKGAQMAEQLLAWVGALVGETVTPASLWRTAPAGAAAGASPRRRFVRRVGG
ncbi:hypothetical protein PICSAR26_04635 [Mycobacterium avium subsp. paratuberculosis]|nr:hypothetical protein PICSAR26_04635 [Mycobacterium avium subsp. paratuberculosis]